MSTDFPNALNALSISDDSKDSSTTASNNTTPSVSLNASTVSAPVPTAAAAAVSSSAADALLPGDVMLPTTPPPNVNLAVKHPLQHRWTWWYDCNQKRVTQTAWGDYLSKVVTVDTVEDFWGLFNNVLAVSRLPQGANYHFFKEGIEPKWEDAQNERGGKWVVTLPAKARGSTLDRLWLWLLLACIGETFEDESEICGCVASVRKGGDKLALWTRTASTEQVQKRIGRQLKRVLELPPADALGYQTHHDAAKRASSFNNKLRYEV